jgi:hypothetical protein
VEDSLGITKTSLGIPLTLTIVQPPTGILAFFGRNGSLLTIGVITVAGLFLAAILLVGGRRSIQKFAARREEKAASHDPLTQPIPVAKVDEKKKSATPFKGWTQRPKRVKAAAYLTRLNGNGDSQAGTPIPLTGEDVVFGADPVKVAFVLDDPSISPRHAKLSQDEQGRFLISDQSSVAGTWVNFEKIDTAGKILAHGDLIHLGKLRYKFTVKRPPVKRTPEIRAEEELS